MADPVISSGGAEGGRTPDLLNAIQALSQLSYSPAELCDYSDFIHLRQYFLIDTVGGRPYYYRT